MERSCESHVLCNIPYGLYKSLDYVTFDTTALEPSAHNFYTNGLKLLLWQPAITCLYEQMFQTQTLFGISHP
jgi:hypothetical protein